jgi:tetratricopeptide (TPR) repeat protein
MLLALAATSLTATAASAAVTVFGSSTARVCYEAALYERSGPADIRNCDNALNDALLSGRDRVATYVNRGILYVQNGDFDRAIADYDRAIAMDANEPEAYLNKALALFRYDREDRSIIPLLTMAIERGTREPAIAYYSRGVAHEIAGDISAAYFDIRRATELAPEWEAPARDITRFRVVGGQGG